MALGKNIDPGRGVNYYRKDDYYMTREGGEEHKLTWGGKLAGELGLSGKVEEADWGNALHGHFPGGIKIRGGLYKEPETGDLKKRAGTDFIIEAPKTASMLYGLTDREDIKKWILDTQEEISGESAKFLEKLIGSRIGAGENGKSVFETSGNGLYGKVRHFVNRDGETFIHDHLVWLNITKNRFGRYQAMTNDRMFAFQRLVKEHADSLWAKKIVAKGLPLEKGKYGETQIGLFTRDQIEFSSNRGKTIEKYIREKWGVERKDATQAMKDEAWEMTRKAKTVKDLDQLETRWKEEAKLSGADKTVLELEKLFTKGKVRGLSPEERLKEARECLNFAVEHHMERESAVGEGEMMRTALQAGRGKITKEDLDKVWKEAIDKKEIIRQEGDGPKQNLVTSRESLDREKRVLKMEKDGRGSVEPIMSPEEADRTIRALEAQEKISLNDEQRAAGLMLLTSSNRFSLVNGYAGVGKTTMLKPTIEAMKLRGYTVLGLGPQHSAVHALKDAGIIDSRTLQSFLVDRKAEEFLTEKTILLIDEACLSNMRDIEAAMAKATRSGAREFFVGDKMQYENPEAGPAVRMLHEMGGMQAKFVTQMQRQNNAPENVREAARLSVNSPEKAIPLLDVREYKNPEERYRAIANDYLQADDRKETLVLVETHETKRAVNSLVREALSLTGKGQTFETFLSYDKTRAQLKRIDTYEEGQRLLFSKKYRSLGVASGEDGKIVSVNSGDGTLSVEMRSGKKIVMTPREMSGKGHKVGQIELMELSQSDRVRVTGNELKKSGITNGMKGDVESVTEKEARIRLDNGKTFTVSREKIAELVHTYAQTGHSAQGLGAGKEKELQKLLKEELKKGKEMVGGVILDIPTHSRMVSRRSFMTNLTRTKNRATVYTDDKTKLEEAVSREKNKTLAHDVEKPMEQEERAKKRHHKVKGRAGMAK